MPIEKNTSIKKANEFFKEKKYEEALHTYKEVLKKYPEFNEFLELNIKLCKRRLGAKYQNSLKRAAVFAGFSNKNIIEDYVLHYLKSLKEKCDFIVYAADNYLSDSEKIKLEGIADFIIAERHGEYDFGSYKRGVAYLKKEKKLDDHLLILCNDSCYGPINNFDNIFSTMEGKNLDFWGLTRNDEIEPHIQSFFLAFTPHVYSSKEFNEFFEGITKQADVQAVIIQYETKLTKILSEAGYQWDVFLSPKILKVTQKQKTNSNLTVFPLFMAENGAELVKVKSISKPTTNLDGIPETLNFIQNKNSKLYAAIEKHGLCNKFLKNTNINFSIILPTHNRSESICKSINSALFQLKHGDEIIVIDDGSTDDTQTLLRKKYNKEINIGLLKIITLQKNSGVANARNIGLTQAKNDWIVYLDSDNLLKSYFFIIYKNIILENPDAKCFYSRVESMTSGQRNGRNFDYNDLLRANYIDIGVFVHKKNNKIKHDTELKRLVDWDFILQYTKNNPAIYFPVTTLIYNDGDDENRISKKESFDCALRVIQKKYNVKPKISTIIFVYNHEKYLMQALESVLAQKGNFEHEIIVLDDASTDKSWDVFLSCSGKNKGRMKGLKHPKNIGQAKNFKTALDLASGEYIAILEGDDYWSDSEKLQKQFNFLDENLNCNMVFSAINVLSENNGSIKPLDRQKNIKNSLLTARDFLDDPSMNLIANFSSCMFRSSVLRKLPEFIYESRVNEIAVAFHFDKYGFIGFIPEILSVYRQHALGLWTGSDAEKQKQMAIEARELTKRISKKCWIPLIDDAINKIKLN